MGTGAKVALATAAGLAAATVAGLATSSKGRKVARDAKTRVKKLMNTPTVRSVKKTINETVDQIMHPDQADLNAMRARLSRTAVSRTRGPSARSR